MTLDETRKLKILLKDCTKGFYQQMYFWGKDVIHPEGNQLLNYGFKKSPSKGIKGTSCYRLIGDDEEIELYGSCAGYYSVQSNVVYLRQRNRFYHWASKQKLVAGRWSQNDLGKSNVDEMFTSLMPFLLWWVNYEQWIQNQLGAEYRDQCFKEWNKVNSQLTWLPPQAAMMWVKEFLESKSHHARPKHWSISQR